MMIKVCSNDKCVFVGKAQPFDDFYKDSHRKDGITAQCKLCRKKGFNKKRHNKRQKFYNKTNKIEIIKYHKQWYQTNKKRLLVLSKNYYNNNKEKILKRDKKYKKRKRLEDINFKIACNLRNRLWYAFKDDFKSGSAIDDLMMSISDFKIYLEKRFYSNPDTGEAMSWDNYGRPNGHLGWDIDHIIPLSSFELTNREELLKACHYTNLRPMWAKQNQSEGARGMKRKIITKM